MHRQIAVLAAAGALAAPAAAQAHVTLQPKTAQAGSFTVLDVRVPNERNQTSTVKVDVHSRRASPPCPTSRSPAGRSR